jgi:hypothetical protein
MLVMISAADTFDSKTHFFKNRNKPLSLVALNFDASVLDRSPGPAK